MTRPYDATLKGLLEWSPEMWLLLSGQPLSPVEVIDADVSTVSAASDKVLRVQSASPWLLDVNFQAGPDASLPRRVHLYNTLLEERHGLRVRSLVVLLAPRANLRALNGTYQAGFPGEEPYRTFRYSVLRVWELPPDQLLQGGLGLLPLIPLSAVTEVELSAVVARMSERLKAQADQVRARELWTASCVLMGLRWQNEVIERVLQGVFDMEESVSYQAILKKGVALGERTGALREARKTLLLQGSKRFGPADITIYGQIEMIEDLERLEQLCLRLLDVNSWQELLA